MVTNQAGASRAALRYRGRGGLHGWSRERRVGAHIDEFQYCPYHEEGVVPQWRQPSDRRKPAPGMILDCLKGWPVRTDSSLLIGDMPHDLKAAAAAGISGHLFEGGDLLSFIRPLLQSGAA